jgi:hypothetical protein
MTQSHSIAMRIDGVLGKLLHDAMRARRKTALTWRLVGLRSTVRWVDAALAAALAVVRTCSLAPADRALGSTCTLNSSNSAPHSQAGERFIATIRRREKP